MKRNHGWNLVAGMIALFWVLAPTASPYQAKTKERAEERMENAYARAMRALDQRNYEEAITTLGGVIEGAGNQADAALYWTAYAQNRLGNRDEALETIALLKEKHSSSRWIKDANALELEVKQAAGEPVSPDNQTDEEMKLLALNALMHSDSSRAVPIIERILKGTSSPRLKERALFVLSQNDSAKAREILTQMAKGDGNPDVQRMAIRNLGIHGGSSAAELLAEVYASQTNMAIKREVIRSFMISGDTKRLAELAKSEKDPSLRREAIRMLGVKHDEESLAELYATEGDEQVRMEIINALMVAGSEQRLMDIASNENDEAMRNKAIQMLGVMGRGKTGDALVELYGKWDDASTKKAVMNALMVQGNGEALVNIARRESNAELKLDAVRLLSIMKDKAATDYVLEILEK